MDGQSALCRRASARTGEAPFRHLVHQIGGALLLLLAVTGCPKPPPKSEFPTAHDALAQMKQTFACANGIQGDGKIDHFSAQGRVRGEVFLFAVNPARVRIDVVSPFGVMLYTLTSNGTDFQMLDTKAKQFLHGPASACNLARLTQVPVPGHVLVSLLRGEAPLLVHEPSAATIAWDEGHYRIEIPSKHDATQRVDLVIHEDDFDKPWQEQRLRVTQVEVSQRGQILYSAELSNHEVAKTAPPRVDEDGLDPDIPPSGGPCNVEIPRSIHMVVPHQGDDVIFQHKEVAFNPPIPEGAFSQPVPGGVKKVFVNCQ
jgi:hypothetical protein